MPRKTWQALLQMGQERHDFAQRNPDGRSFVPIAAPAPLAFSDQLSCFRGGSSLTLAPSFAVRFAPDIAAFLRASPQKDERLPLFFSLREKGNVN